MLPKIHPSWRSALATEFESDSFAQLSRFVDDEYSRWECFPSKENVFRAFELTPLSGVKVVILGQDPYHTPGAAMGLSFSVPNGSKFQPSLRNIFKELETDLGIVRTDSNLSDWAEKGVLLLNSVLTVRSGEPASHKNRGWETFTDGAISALSNRNEPIVFVLWGAYAQAKIPLIDQNRHTILVSAHPSPFSARKWFFGSKPFSKANQALIKWSSKPIDW